MSAAVSSVIELQVERIDRLFDALDPLPIPSRDLAGQAEDFVVGWARELPEDAPLRVIVHAPKNEADSEAARLAPAAFQRYFTYRAQRISGDIGELFRIGRYSLLIGLGVLAACIIAGRILDALFGGGDVARFLKEGLLILGWVANWRPIEIFLYDWWPLVRRRRLFRRLALAPVEVKAAG